MWVWVVARVKHSSSLDYDIYCNTLPLLFCFFFLVFCAWLYLYALLCWKFIYSNLYHCSYFSYVPFVWLAMLYARICSFISFTVLLNYEPFFQASVLCTLARKFFVVHKFWLFPSLIIWQTSIQATIRAREKHLTDVFSAPATFFFFFLFSLFLCPSISKHFVCSFLLNAT